MGGAGLRMTALSGIDGAPGQGRCGEHRGCGASSQKAAPTCGKPSFA